MASPTVENYLKAALQIATTNQSEWVSTGELAAAMNVAPGTVTSMLKTLDEAGLATYKPYEGARLTESGRTLALRMLRRHRLIELFLVNTLNLTWDRVHAEAEDMEHAVSDYLVERIDEYLGRPSFDPHGDPIPAANGEMRYDVESAVPLSVCSPGTEIKLVRVVNQGPEFLRYLSESGFELGTTGTVKENSSEAGVVTMKLGKKSVTMGSSAAEQLLVERTN
jgi:DtxR family Mn-dependent transcriptional regulator